MNVFCCRFARFFQYKERIYLYKRRTTYLQISLENEQKEYIKTKAEKLGYKSVSAFLVSAAYNQINLTMDMKVYRDLTKEINYIGKNINSLIHRINIDGIYSDSDIDFLRVNQEKIWDIINKEYDKLLDTQKNFTSDNLSIDSLEKLKESLVKNEMPIPKKIVLEEVYEMIKNDFIYLIECIKNSKEQDEDISEYLFEYVYGDTLFELDEDSLINFSNEIFTFTQKIKFKMLKLEYNFSDDDWFELKDILDEYEIF